MDGRERWPGGGLLTAGLLRLRRWRKRPELGVPVTLWPGESGADVGAMWPKLRELDIMLEVAILRPPHLGHLRGEVSVEEG